MPTILLTNHYEGKPLKIITDVIPDNFELKILPEATKENLLRLAPEADYFLVSGRLSIDLDVLNKAQNLKMIQRTGVGLDVFDFKALEKKNIPLYINHGVNSQSVAEHTLLLILASLRRLTAINNNTKSGIWEKQQQGLTTHELAGLTVGIVGMGNIGQRAAKMLQGFDVRIVYTDEYPLPKEKDKELNIKNVELEELFSLSDIISLHCPLTDQTRHLVCKETIQKMKSNVIIINTARGALIAEEDLAEALQNGKVAYAGIDVYENEPPKNSKFMQLENVITTPHIGGVTYDSFQRMMQDAVRNIALFEAGELEEIKEHRYGRVNHYGK